jgi:diaminopropionate ammonia-lyase
MTVEPETAACVLASLEAGELTTIETGETIMAGLNCGTPSALAWPYLRAGLDAAVAVSNDECRLAMSELHTAGVGAGPCGAASLAGLRKSPVDGVVVLLSTEGG